MWCNYYTYDECRRTNQQTNTENVKQSLDQLAACFACSQLVFSCYANNYALPYRHIPHIINMYFKYTLITVFKQNLDCLKMSIQNIVTLCEVVAIL